MTYYLAVDFGASSGKHFLAWLEDGKIKFEEIHRFKNKYARIPKPDNSGYTLCWDIDYLFGEIISGLKKCAETGKKPSFVGIDTWGVDYALLNGNGNIIGNVVSYRDKRTEKIPELVFDFVSEEELYEITGIQKQPFNTIFQLYSQSLHSPRELQKAKSLLMLPCYFNYLLTGIRANEYTVASTSGLVNAKSRDWDRALIEKIGLKRDMFCDIIPSGTVLGEFTRDIAREVGYNVQVVLVEAHDTAAAVLATPLTEKSIFLSSGTWSLMGVENSEPILNHESRAENFTNEGGSDGKYRFLKNIMGLWLLREIKNEFGDLHSYENLSNLARENRDFPSLIDVSDNRFLAPDNMVEEIKKSCASSDMPVPAAIGEISAVIYRSLADYYGKTARKLEEHTGKSYDIINMVGGGTRDRYLNKLTAEACKKRVITGPTEATALGNIISQMFATGEIKNARQAREIIRNSVPLEEYDFE